MKKIGLLVCLLIFSLFSFDQYFVAAASAENGWVTKTSMPTARYNTGSAVIDGKIYVHGGTPGHGVFNTLEYYDPTTDRWATGASSNLARSASGFAEVDGKLYVIGGSVSNGETSIVQAYDPVQNSWTQKQAIPTARRHIKAVAVDKQIFTFGGVSGSTKSNQVHSYDIEKNTWTSKKEMPFTGTLTAAFEHNNFIYAIRLDDDRNSEIYKYDYNQDSWELANVLPSTVIIKGFDYKGKILLVGQDVIHTYNLSTNVLTPVPNSEFKKRSAVVEISNDKMYLIGGSYVENGSASGGMNVVEEFDLSRLNDLEPEPNPEPNPEPQPSGDRAILVVTMTTGLEKEYDLPMSEINSFLNWYDARDAGTGSAKYAINKHNNNKGPFSKRIDYVIFDKILTFEVSEYTTK